MSLINSTAIPSGASAYEIEQSLRFNDDDSAYLSRTPSSASNRKTWTWSGWLKRGNLSTYQTIFAVDNGSTEIAECYWDGSDNSIFWHLGGGSNYRFYTNAIYRDSSAWYHIVCSLDTTISSPSGNNTRMKLYVNGEQVTSFRSNATPSLNYEGLVNLNTQHEIGKRNGTHNPLDGYLGEVHFIDGTAKAPTDFGEFGTYGEWKPREYSGTYGTNGFYLPFKQDYTVEGFSTVLYTGTAFNETYIGGAGFQPDLTFIARRKSAENHIWIDSVRGSNKRLLTNASDGEATDDNIITGFTTDGFTVGTNGGSNAAHQYVAWNWDMGGSNATNTNGNIQSTVRANATYGQSIVSYTGNGTAGATIGHGLSSTPEMIIQKRRDGSGSWQTYHSVLGATKIVYISHTNAAATETWPWNDTAPTANVFSVGNDAFVNANNGTYVAYCFHSVANYSKFSSYTGNGSTTGPSVTLGFAPAFLLIKSSTQAEPWSLIDNQRRHSSTLLHILTTNSTAVETQYAVDLNSNGFQIKDTTGVLNANNQTYIYMAFADKREYAYWLDQSGNNNDWTSNNLTESDVMVDSPTNNFATLNPLAAPGHTASFSEGNLKAQTATSSSSNQYGSMAMSSGKWYWEIVCVAQSSDEDPYIYGIVSETANPAIRFRQDAKGYGYHGYDGKKFNNNDGGASYGNAFTAGDIISVAFDSDNGTLKFYKNGTVQNSGTAAFTSITGTYFSVQASISSSRNVTYVANFGQDSSFAGNKTAQGNQDGNSIGDFYYAPPTGYLALCTSNLPDVAVVPSENFNTVLYTGTDATNSTHAITGVNFQPDLVWTKDRDAAYDHYLFDSVRGTGVTKGLSSSSSRVEGMANESYDALSSFDSDGFTITGAAFGSLYQDRGSADYVSWNWKAGNATLGTGAFTQGSSASTCSRNVDAGFSIVTYTGTGSTATVGHGLSKAPEMMIIRSREVLDNWLVFANTGSMDATDGMYFDSTTAKLDSDTFFNDTAPTNSLFTVKSHSTSNTNTKPYIAYCFHSVDGFSAVGQFIGNGSADGSYVHTGFSVQWVMIKRADDTSHWQIHDTARDPHNVMGYQLHANSTDADASASAYYIDSVSNGFKLRMSHAAQNASGGTYIYLAFASVPFKFGNAR